MTAPNRSRPRGAGRTVPAGGRKSRAGVLDGSSGDGHEQHATNLIICDSQPIFAQGLLQLLLHEAPEFEVSGITSSVDDLLEMARRVLPDLVLLDARFGIEPAQPLLSISPSVKVILVASADLEIDLTDAVAAGVCAYLLKEQGISDIIQVLRLVLSGLLVIPAALARSTLRSRQGGLHALSAIEHQILEHIVQGETNREIARALNLSERTVRRRVIQVYGKLQVTDRLEAALYAERHGIRVTDREADREDRRPG